MDNTAFQECFVPEDVLQILLSASNSSTLIDSLETLIQVCRTADGRADLASKSILPSVVQLIQSLPYPSGRHLLTLSLKLLRNLCAGEVSNQNSFLEQSGVAIISNVLNSANLSLEPDSGIIRMGLQVLANVSLAGERHQHAIWQQLFPKEFLALARVQSREACDPLCMVIFACCDGSPELFEKLCGDGGITIMKEIVRTTAAVGFGEDWFKLLLSRICLEGPYFSSLFSNLGFVSTTENVEDTEFREDLFSSEQAFLLRIISDILNERLREITVSSDFALCVFGIFKKSVGVLNCVTRGQSGLPTSSSMIDVLGYSLTILRDVCAQKTLRGFQEDLGDAVDVLLSHGLIELILCLLRDLEPPAIIRKAIKQVIGNCSYQRKPVQDEIRQKDGILLLLQQCGLDEDNPFLKEWGIWCVRNLLEGNEDNKRLVTELELQGSVDAPEIAGLGLRVEVNPKTGRPKLVNIS
ncbi:ataxin-10 [Prunus yedoensis var. nudiflora]|uniref:Ataxin-10 n=1 Tax=Prunus yedoensis var. nudiflora TaxID=2094558 RepID=A0A314XH11_PRUYE|nr:ataxin-10 [Prunus yedoensis var. nudiflora]